MVGTTKSNTIARQERKHENLKWAIESRYLTIAIIDVEVIFTSCQGWWQKFAPWEKLTKLIYLVEIYVATGRYIYVLRFIVLHDPEVFYHGSILLMSTGDRCDYFEMWVDIAEVRYLLLLLRRGQLIFFLLRLAHSLFRRVALIYLILASHVEVWLRTALQNDIIRQHPEVLNLINRAELAIATSLDG